MSATFVPVCRQGVVADYAWIDEEDLCRVQGYRWFFAGFYAYAGARLLHGIPSLGAIPMHRLVLGVAQGDGVVHHVNEDPLDNRRCNLKWLPSKLHHGAEPHPRRDMMCSPNKPSLPPHEREVALALAELRVGFTQEAVEVNA